MSTVPAVEPTGRLLRYTDFWSPVVVADSSSDISDLSMAEWAEAQEAAIMALPPKARKAVFGSLSPILADISLNQATFRAMEQAYTRDGVRFHGLDGVDDGGIARGWLECYPQARALRERRTLMTALVRSAIQHRSTMLSGGQVELVSIASGSARAVIEALEQTIDIPVHCRLLDWDGEARAYSTALAATIGVADRIDLIDGDILSVENSLGDHRADIVEAVGIMDYFSDRTSLFFLEQIYDLLADGGVLVASNVLPNPGQEFLHTALGWSPMYYRTEDEFARQFLGAGFGVDQLKVYKLPTGFHCLVEATRTR